MNRDSKIYVAGHRGLVGSALVQNLRQKGYENLLFRTHAELDLTNQQAVADFFEREKPEYVFLAAAKVGGIQANNTYRADFIYQNLMIQNNVIHQSYLHGVKKLLFLGSSCIYPKNAPQPMKEEYLLTSELEYTNEPYAIAKIAGIKMCESYNLQYGTNFISVMPTNLYGPNDNFDLETSHVLPALLRKMHEAKIRGDKEVNVWGTGKPQREFLYSEDMAEACMFVMESVDFINLIKGREEIRNAHLNIGTGEEMSISELAEMIQDIVGFEGKLVFDTTKPDGMMRKMVDSGQLHLLGWQHKTDLRSGIQKVYEQMFERAKISK